MYFNNNSKNHLQVSNLRATTQHLDQVPGMHVLVAIHWLTGKDSLELHGRFIIDLFMFYLNKLVKLLYN